MTVLEPNPSEQADRLHHLWSDERCAVRFSYDESPNLSWPWTVDLEWTSEGDNEHHADWATYVWQFYGETLQVALVEAVKWCEALVPWRRCSACGGRRWWKEPGEPCDECGGSGLEGGQEGGTADDDG